MSGLRVSDGANEYICTTESLVAALELLAEGRDPTRSNFQSKGIKSNTEVSGAVDLLVSLGYIDPVIKGSPADWADGVLPYRVGAIADELRRDFPALPYFEAAGLPTEISVPGYAGRPQAGSKRGRA